MSELHLDRLRDYVARVPPWVLAAALMALVLAGYYASLGARFWTAKQQAELMTGQIAALGPSLGRTSVEQEEALLDATQARWERLLVDFDAPDANALMGAIAEAARDANVSLDSITTSQASSELRGGVEFQVMSFALALRGSVQDLLAFFELVRSRIPSAEVGALQVAMSGSEPAVRTRLAVLSSPKPPPPKEKAPTRTATPAAGDR